LWNSISITTTWAFGGRSPSSGKQGVAPVYHPMKGGGNMATAKKKTAAKKATKKKPAAKKTTTKKKK
jgi:topoisomerase IA-like protein